MSSVAGPRGNDPFDMRELPLGEAAPAAAAGGAGPREPRLAAVAAGLEVVGVGERGEHVRLLQEALVLMGDLPAGGADGVFGRGTERALAAFQRANSIAPSGRLNAATLQAIDRRLADPLGTPGEPRLRTRPAPEPLRNPPQSYLKDREAREAYEFIERKLWTGASLLRGIDMAVTDEDARAVLDRLDALSSKDYAGVLHALAATRASGDDERTPTLLDKLIVRGTSQFGNATLSDRFCRQLERKLGPEPEPDRRILRHVSPDSVERLKGWASFRRLLDAFG
jgi:hypothetical protein